MKEIPILFSTPMVKAILEGRKTMTRRLNSLGKINKPDQSFYFQSLVHHATGRFTFVEEGNYNPSEKDVIIAKPPYNRDDLLYVRETFCPTGSDEYLNISTNKPFFYKADVKEEGIVSDMMPQYGWKWSPSIHMPKSAARIWLKVTELRVERLHQITDQDAIAEGIKREVFPQTGSDCYYFYPCNDLRDDSYIDYPKTSFYSLWKSINGQESWDRNPWVWVISFEVLSTTGKPNAQAINH